MKLMSVRAASLALVILAFVVTALSYSSLPAQIPTHWNLQGQVDDYTAKPLGPFVGALLVLLAWALLSVIPAISPHGFTIDDFRRFYDRIVLGTVLFLFELMAVMLAAAMGYRVPVNAVIVVSVGVLLVILGNYMGKVRRNFFVGIRTPWTLASEEVWFRTHRLGGKLLVAGGLLIAALGLAGYGVVTLLTIVIAVAVLSVAYSYIVYRELEKQGKIEA